MDPSKPKEREVKKEIIENHVVKRIESDHEHSAYALIQYQIYSDLRLMIDGVEKDRKKSVTSFETYPRYSELQVIGSGSYGTVVAAEDILTDQYPLRKDYVAIKKARTTEKNKVSAVYTAFRVLREIIVLRAFNHPKIVKLLMIQEIPDKHNFDHIYIVTELMKTNLRQRIRDRSYTPNEIPIIIYQILCALKYIHSSGVIHRDLKPENILCDDNNLIKLCDFGSVYGPSGRLFSRENYIVTRYYRAPELICNRNQNYFATPAIDMWSVGCILSELYRTKPVFQGKNEKEQFIKYIQLLDFPNPKDFGNSMPGEYLKIVIEKDKIPRFDFVEYLKKYNTPDIAIDLIKKCLTWNVKQRIKVDEALAHPFFQNVRDPDEEEESYFRVKFEYEFKFKGPEDVRKKIYNVSMQYNPKIMLDNSSSSEQEEPLSSKQTEGSDSKKSKKNDNGDIK